MSQARTWRLLCAAELGAVESALTPLLRAWQGECLPSTCTATLQAREAREEDFRKQPDHALALLDAKGEACARLSCSGPLLDWLQEQAGFGPLPAMRGPGQAGTVRLGELAGIYLLRELLSRLAGQASGGAAREKQFRSGEAAVFNPGQHAGAVLLEIAFAGAGATVSPGLRVALGYSLVQRWCRDLPASRGALATRAAPSQLTLSFRVLAGEAILPLSSLMQLEAGDVLRLDSRPEQGLLLETRDGQALCQAGLGLHHGRPALQVCAEGLSGQ